MDVLFPRIQHPEFEGKRNYWDMEEELQLLKVRLHGFSTDKRQLSDELCVYFVTTANEYVYFCLC